MAFPTQAALFGPDNRSPIHEGTSLFQFSRSTAVAVLSSNIEDAGPGRKKLNVESLSGLVCKEEKFSQEVSLAYACTGFLVGPDLLVTAGHCAVNVGESRNETETYCQAFSWLFDYRAGPSGKVNINDIPAMNHYKCKKTIFAVRDEKAPHRDFALIQLDRKVTGRLPYKLSTSVPKVNDKLFMMGHPMGTPLKLSPDARVLLNDLTRESMITNLDAFEGNSGSPVFNQNKEVVGILIGGTPSGSLIEDPVRKCHTYNRCDENGENCQQSDRDTSIFPGFQRVGSEVQKIQSVIETIEKYKKNEI